jgi:hypothetical protein
MRLAVLAAYVAAAIAAVPSLAIGGENIPDMKCNCPGSTTFHPSFTISGNAETSDDAAWRSLEQRMGAGSLLDLVKFYANLDTKMKAASCLEGACTCNNPTVSGVTGDPDRTGYSGTVKVINPNVTPPAKEYTYTWTYSLTVTVSCACKEKVTPGRPKLE